MNYLLLLKAAPAEMRAWKNLSATRKSKIDVHMEITRGRKKITKNGEPQKEYNIESIYDWVVKEFKGCRGISVDLTREVGLSSNEILALASSKDGYAAWVQKVNELHARNSLVRPTLIVNPDEGDDAAKYEADIFSQFDSFTRNFDHLTYRVSVLHDPEFLSDIEILADRINAFNNAGGTFRIILDFEYISPSTADIQAAYAANIVRELKRLVPLIEIYSVGTSFPKDVTRIGNERTDEFRVSEVHLNRAINRLQNFRVGYGDYGSINPERNDVLGGPGVFMRARVDFPTNRETVYYYRVDPDVDKEAKVLLSPRSIMYKKAAALTVSDPRFLEIGDSWGCRKLQEAATGLPEGSSPSFWISARMEMHICQQLNRLEREASA